MKLSLAFSAEGLDLALYRRRGLHWRLQQHAQLPLVTGDNLSFAEMLQATLRPKLIAWNIPAQTSVLVVPPQEVGGVLSLPFTGPAAAVADQCERSLAERLPFALRELAYWWQLGAGEQGLRTLSIGWLPRSWVDEVRSSLNRLGLRVVELYARPFLHALPAAADRGGPSRGQSNRLLLEQEGQHLIGTLYQAGLPLQKFCLDASDASLCQQQLALALLDLPDTLTLCARDLPPPIRQVCLQRWPDIHIVPSQQPQWAQLAFAHWQAGAAGLWLAPPSAAVMAKITPWLIGLAVLLLASVVYTSWRERGLKQSVAVLEASSDRLQGPYRAASARQRELFALQAQQAAAETFAASPSPLQALAVLTDSLPAGSWLTHYHDQGKVIHAEGYGADSLTVVQALETSAYAVTSVPPRQPAAAGQQASPNPTLFAIDLHDRIRPRAPKPASPARPQSGSPR